MVRGSNAAVEAKRATSTIPIVAYATSDLVALGLVASLAHPGGNLTGIPTSSGARLAGKQLELLRATIPGLTRLAVLVNPSSNNTILIYPATESAAASLGMDLLRLEVRSAGDFQPAFTQARARQAQAVIALADGAGVMNTNADQIAQLALQSRLASIAAFKSPFADAGLMMTYGAEAVAVAAAGRAAVYVDKILRGAKPADLPVEEPTTFQFVVNLRTAQALGITTVSA